MIKTKAPLAAAEDRSSARQNAPARRHQNDGYQQAGGNRGNSRYRWRRQHDTNARESATAPSNAMTTDVSRQQRRYHSGQHNRQNRSFPQQPQENQQQHHHFTPANPRQNPQSATSKDGNTSTATSPPVLPGYTYDPSTKKYFKIASDNSGVAGFTRADLARSRREKERLAAMAAHRPRFASGSFAVRPVTNPITSMVNALSLGNKGCLSKFQRCIPESRLLNVNCNPNSIQDSPLCSTISSRARGCQFLSVSNDGLSLLGCWASQSEADSDTSYVVCMDARIDEKVRMNAILEEERRPLNSNLSPLNTMGLVLDAQGICCEVSDPILVDMCVAPVDSDVTCCLYVTAATKMTSQGLRTRCCIFLQPVSEWSSPESVDILSSPIYNLFWTAESSIWSCAWSGNKMRVALGLDDSAKIVDVVTEQHFVISSKRKNVISQEFSPDGNLIYMGLRTDDVIRSDLRMSSRHVTGSFRGSRNAGWIHQLKSSHPDCLLTETFSGELKLWDSRRSDMPLMEMRGHRNSHYKLPCHVDSEERFVFAVGEDGCTRGWSLTSGDLLCAVASPRPVDNSTDFPHVVYSDCWGGKPGNAALVLAVGDSCRVHQLDM